MKMLELTTSSREPGIVSGIKACVMTLDYTDTGYIYLESFEPALVTGEISGRITHLNGEGFIDSIGKSPFTIRFLTSENSSLVELVNCRLIEVVSNREIRFSVDSSNRRDVQIPQPDMELTEVMFDGIQSVMTARKFNHIVFVLGAGASIDVLPAGAEILRSALESNPSRDVQRFLVDVFKADISKKLPFPSFNQVLNVIDIALEREEGLNADYSLDELRKLKKALIDMLRRFLIDHAPNTTNNNYYQMAMQLKSFYDNGGKLSFITLNYDLLLDYALSEVFGNEALNYVLSLTPWSRNKEHESENGQNIREENTNIINVVKLHGSLDWMICPTCFDTYKFSDLQMSLTDRTCSGDHTVLHEFLFPPTKERVEVHSHWIRLQHEADRLLRKADKTVFIGFSLSDDDAHLRFKLKKHLHRIQNPAYLQVIGRPAKQFDIATSETAKHYWRFFGPIDYRSSGFADFARRPY